MSIISDMLSSLGMFETFDWRLRSLSRCHGGMFLSKWLGHFPNIFKVRLSVWLLVGCLVQGGRWCGGWNVKKRNHHGAATGGYRPIRATWRILLKDFFFDQKKECVTWFNKNLSVPSYSCLAIVVDLWILKNIWDTMSIYQSTPWWTFFFSMARYELEAGTAHKHDDLPKRVTSGASLQAWKFWHFLP